MSFNILNNMSSHICPICGRSSDEIRFIDAFCIDCYPIKLKFPSKIEIEQCTKCKKMHIRGKWINADRDKISKYVIGKCKGDFDSGRYDPKKQIATFVMRKSNITISKRIAIKIKKTICWQCSRISGGYYEAIIQLRGEPPKVKKYARIFMKNLSKRTFIAKEKENKRGLDIYVGNSKVVVELMSKLRLKTLITKKLVGASNGKRLYRTTFLVKLTNNRHP